MGKADDVLKPPNFRDTLPKGAIACILGIFMKSVSVASPWLSIIILNGGVIYSYFVSK